MFTLSSFCIQYFVKNFNNSCFENFMPTSPQLDAAVAAILQKYLARSSVGKLRIGRSFDLIG